MQKVSSRWDGRKPSEIRGGGAQVSKKYSPGGDVGADREETGAEELSYWCLDVVIYALENVFMEKLLKAERGWHDMAEQMTPSYHDYNLNRETLWHLRSLIWHFL